MAATSVDKLCHVVPWSCIRLDLWRDSAGAGDLGFGVRPGIFRSFWTMTNTFATAVRWACMRFSNLVARSCWLNTLALLAAQQAPRFRRESAAHWLGIGGLMSGEHGCFPSR